MVWGVTGRTPQAKGAEPGHHHHHHPLPMVLVHTSTQGWSTIPQVMIMQTVPRLLGNIVTTARRAQHNFPVAHACRWDVPALHSSPGCLSQSTWRSEGMACSGASAVCPVHAGCQGSCHPQNLSDFTSPVFSQLSECWSDLCFQPTHQVQLCGAITRLKLSAKPSPHFRDRQKQQ